MITLILGLFLQSSHPILNCVCTYSHCEYNLPVNYLTRYCHDWANSEEDTYQLFSMELLMEGW